jgi:hypothetical protein
MEDIDQAEQGDSKGDLHDVSPEVHDATIKSMGKRYAIG